MKTPGGGGYGEMKYSEENKCIHQQEKSHTFIERGKVFEYRQTQESA